MQTCTYTYYNDDYFTVTSCKTFPILFAICFFFKFFLSFQNEIISLSEKYVRALSRENTDIVDGPYAGRFTAYGIYIYNCLYNLSYITF